MNVRVFNIMEKQNFDFAVASMTTQLHMSIRINMQEFCDRGQQATLLRYSAPHSTWLQVLEFGRIDEDRIRVNSMIHINGEPIERSYIIEWNYPGEVIPDKFTG